MIFSIYKIWPGWGCALIKYSMFGQSDIFCCAWCSHVHIAWHKKLSSGSGKSKILFVNGVCADVCVVAFVPVRQRRVVRVDYMIVTTRQETSSTVFEGYVFQNPEQVCVLWLCCCDENRRRRGYHCWFESWMTLYECWTSEPSYVCFWMWKRDLIILCTSKLSSGFFVKIKIPTFVVTSVRVYHVFWVD
jgi:hypothetical protein